MKNLTPFLTLLIAFSLITLGSACNKDDDDAMPSNVLIIDGNTYNLAKGFIEDFGDNGNGSFDFDITLTSSEISAASGFLVGTGDAIYMDLNTNNMNGLVAGTYNYTALRDAFTMVEGNTFEDFDFSNIAGTFGSISSGSVTVSLNGNETRFEWDFMTTDNKSVTGNFQGILQEI